MAQPRKTAQQDDLQRLLATPPQADEKGLSVGDEIYLQVWGLEQTNTNARWTITTFFISVSFAIFGFSFQTGLDAGLASAARLGALLIYWFAYGIFMRFNAYTRIVRGYLRDLEQRGETRIPIQQRALQQLGGRGLSATQLLRLLGFAYIVGVTLLWALAF